MENRISVKTNEKIFSADQCILELVANSLSAKASAVAIRFDILEGKIQVIDNGRGIVKSTLQSIAESANKKKLKNYKDTTNTIFEKIRKNSNSLIITSRCRLSLQTYVNIFKKGYFSKVIRGVHRPSHGTTVSIRGFQTPINESSESVIYFLVATFALFNTEVSFSLRDNVKKDVVIRISKPHDPIKVLEYICENTITKLNTWYLKSNTKSNFSVDGYVGFMPEVTVKICHIFVNYKIMRSQKLEEKINKVMTKVHALWLWKDLSDKKIFYLLYIMCPPTEYTLSMIKGECHITFLKPDIVESIKRCLKNTVIKSCIRTQNSFELKNVEEKLRKEGSGERKFIKKEKLKRSSISNGTNTHKIFTVKSKINTIAQNDSIRKKLKSAFCKMHKETISKAILDCLFKQNRNVDGIHLKKHASLLRKSSLNIKRYIAPKNCEKKTKDRKTNDKVEVVNFQKRSSIIESPENTSEFLLEKPKASLKPSSYTCTSRESVGTRTDSNSITFLEAENGNSDMPISQLSEWSNWSYHPLLLNNSENFPVQEVNVKRYQFLPLKLHNLLLYEHKKIICGKVHQDDGFDEEYSKEMSRKFTDATFNRRHQDMEVRNCEMRGNTSEFKLTKKSLYKIEVLNQINYEFIVTLTVQDGKKLLVLMDQHAVDERIRYEELLEFYRLNGKKDEYVLEKLKSPITITDLGLNAYKLLTSNVNLLKKFGILFKTEDQYTMSITSVPKCFLKRKYWEDDLRLITCIRKLLLEIAESLSNTNTTMILPPSIHLAIATEACHGAIKFGDPLNIKQCELLLKALRNTNGPTRCAHGRPSIVPILDVTNLSSRSKIKTQKKLNFASLKRR